MIEIGNNDEMIVIGSIGISTQYKHNCKRSQKSKMIMMQCALRGLMVIYLSLSQTQI